MDGLVSKEDREMCKCVTMAVVVGLSLAVMVSANIGIDTVPVGNPGNVPDTRYTTPGYGAVAYTYNIGKYEVTAGQYTAFLNAVAKIDTYQLYALSMGRAEGCGIARSGAGTVGDPYTYSVASDFANRPVNWVSYWDCGRFANWLHNGQPTGAQGAGTTERGAYTLDGYNGTDGRTIQRNANWKWAVTSDDEWYKAAYHKNDGVTGNYFDYPTSSDSVPSNVLGNPTDPGNNATYYSNGYTIGSPYYRTEVGAHENSESPYGTFDQGGNVYEWNEAVLYERSRGLRGGSFSGYDYDLRASYRDSSFPMLEYSFIGFRVSEVPEPAALSLLALGGVMVLRRRKR